MITLREIDLYRESIMDRLVIRGPAKLSGKVSISGAKNAALPILFATLLNPGKSVISNVPQLRDIATTIKLLEILGAKVTLIDSHSYEIDSSNIDQFEATYELVKTMRASILTLGPLLARFGKAKVSLPGGCAIGARPIDIHLKAMEELGAKIELKSGYVEASAPDGLKGTDLTLSFPSVGATENIMMAAAYAEGKTIIRNAAREPEINNLADYLNKLGVEVIGAGTATIELIPSGKFMDCSHTVMPDRIEAATFIIAAIMTQSQITVENMNSNDIRSVLDHLKNMGANLKISSHCVEVLEHEKILGAQIDTAPYPGFPTDVQAQMMALCMCADTPSIISENIFENRFMHVPELQRMGGAITLKGNTAIISPSEQLTSAPVMCTDLRASASLVLAALVAEGETHVQRIYHLDRGYEAIENKLRALGVDISRTNPGDYL